MNGENIPDQKPKPTPNDLIAIRLREWRRARRLPLKAVAAEFGVSPATWSRWEQANRFPSPAFVARLSEYLSLPVCRLFYERDLPCPSCPYRETESAGAEGQSELTDCQEIVS